MNTEHSEKTYTAFKRTVDAVFLCLLLNTALAQFMPNVLGFFALLFETAGISADSMLYGYLTEILNILLYLLTFIIPAVIIRIFLPATNEKISFDLKIPPKYPMVFIAFMGACLIAGQVTNVFEMLLEKAGIGVIGYSLDNPTDFFGIVLLIISSAVVPAIAEELLFRKVILERLIPYGQGFAIVMTSIMFSLMHANPTQLLYAFIGGLFFGFVTVKTKSLFPSMLMHFVNNVFYDAIAYLGEFLSERTFTTVVGILDMIIKTVGIVCLCLLTKNRYFSLSKTDDTEFSPYKRSVRIFSIVYLAYTLIILTEWIVLL